MNVQAIQVDMGAALHSLNEYREHRNVYDKRDWEIERIYRAVSRGKTVIAALDAIRQAGVDDKRRPKLAICQADAERCRCSMETDQVIFGSSTGKRFGWRAMRDRITVPWPGTNYGSDIEALVPRIPPQHRPNAAALHNYHILWEADWQDIPRDPYLLRRIGKDAWVVLAAWDLTDVELSVLRAHRAQ